MLLKEVKMFILAEKERYYQQLGKFFLSAPASTCLRMVAIKIILFSFFFLVYFFGGETKEELIM